ncbi:hypothetical protein F383_00041 [Gossypium arboreum]|uniref:Uncharacterized protein n=1 Tax=Gossypium arboreum TaxID=29729 RepID=A0A0B0NPS2_GOSAR|nr:hypothetical protein F383_00041 [Gossypium arboreum]
MREALKEGLEWPADTKNPFLSGTSLVSSFHVVCDGNGILIVSVVCFMDWKMACNIFLL